MRHDSLLTREPVVSHRLPRQRRGQTRLGRARRLALATGLSLAVTIALGSGIALAYFTASGHGTGSGSAATLQGVTISATAGTPATPLLPGGTGDVTLQVINSNSFAVTLTGVTANGTITASGSCSPASSYVTFTAPGSLSTNVPANGTTQVDLPGAASMSLTTPAVCQSASFKIPVTITVQK
jgi:hypothetical protein